jgi:hypothetical protein
MDMPPFSDLAPHELRLPPGDGADARILWLVNRRLVHVGTRDGGWEQLYRDPRDGRYWELTFPHGSLHGGGHRQLSRLSSHEAQTRYGIGADSL